jgi:hypothetical protein
MIVTGGGIVAMGDPVGGIVSPADGATDPDNVGELVGMRVGATGHNSRRGGARSLFAESTNRHGLGPQQSCHAFSA